MPGVGRYPLQPQRCTPGALPQPQRDPPDRPSGAPSTPGQRLTGAEEGTSKLSSITGACVRGRCDSHIALGLCSCLNTPFPSKHGFLPGKPVPRYTRARSIWKALGGTHTHTPSALLPQQPFNEFLIHANRFSISVFCFPYLRFTHRRSGRSGGEEGSLTDSAPRGSIASTALIKGISFPLSKQMPRNPVLFVVCLLLL